MGARVLVVDDSPTIRKVVQSILEASSYESVTAADGQEALAVLAREKVDLVLVDFVMPRMNGYQFCRELRNHAELRLTPVVLMSAKGDKIRGQFVQQTGALDAITKPFDARGLIAVVEAALKKHERVRTAQQHAPLVSEPDESAQDSLAPDSTELSRDPAERRVQAAAEFATALGKLALPELLKVGALSTQNSTEVTEAILRAVTAESMGSLTSLLRALDFGEGTHEVLAGDVAVISIAEVMQLLQMQRQTGALNVAKRGAEVTFFMREGSLDVAMARGLDDEFLISRYFIEQGLVSREQIDEILGDTKQPPRLFGERLLDRGLVTAAQVHQALLRQSSEIVYETVRWRKGRFSFTVNVSHPVADQARLKLSPGALVMEGFRRVDEWRLIEDSFDFDDVLHKDSAAIERLSDSQLLTGLERNVLESIDGERTVREIVDEITGSSFEVCKIIYQFVNSRLVRRKGT